MRMATCRHHRASIVAIGGLALVAAALGDSPTTAPSYPAFDNLPAPTIQKLDEFPAMRGFAVHPGTYGLRLPVPPRQSASSIAILGDLSPTNAASETYLRQTVSELNLLKPDLVLTLGNLVQGMTRSGQTYLAQVQAVRGKLDTLTMPWYPCLGPRDLLSGTLDPTDRRFAALYQKYIGPRHYSLDVGDVHAIVLDSEDLAVAGEDAGKDSDSQLAWLKADLNRTFDAHRAAGVLVLLHHPMWHDQGRSRDIWIKVHELLVDFNRKPIVSVEGPEMGGNSGGGLRPAKILGVFAGDTCAYAQDPAVDGIAYFTLGATAAAIEQDGAEMLRHYTLLKIDSAGKMTVALVQLGGSAEGKGANILPADTILAEERALIEQAARIDEKSLGVEGVLEQPVGKDSGKAVEEGPMRLVLANPLSVPIDVEVRLASARNLATATERDNANPFTDSFDLPWELHVAYTMRHLAPGQKEKWRMSLYCKQQRGELPPPQVEFVVRFNDSRGRTHQVLLKRRIAVVPAATVPIVKNIALGGDNGWHDAYRGSTYAWTPRADEPQKRSADWEMIADDTHLYVRVHVDDDHHVFWPKFTGPGDLLSDAIELTWLSRTAQGEPARTRLVVFPFAEKGKQIWDGYAKPRDEKAEVIPLHLDVREDRYNVTLAIPRKGIFAAPGLTAQMNIAVYDNDGSAKTFVRAWAPPDPSNRELFLGGMVTLKPPVLPQPESSIKIPFIPELKKLLK